SSDHVPRSPITTGHITPLCAHPRRKPESPITQREMDVAASVQVVTEEIVLRMARHVQRETGLAILCLAGGVARNCVANGRLLREGPFERLWIQPAAGDAGGAVGVALAIEHKVLGNPRSQRSEGDGMKGSYLGPAFSDDEIARFLAATGAGAEQLPLPSLLERTAHAPGQAEVVGRR